MITIDFTYQTTTEESAEFGDYDSSGFITPGMWKYPDLYNYDRNEWKIGDLSALISFAQELGIHSENDSLYSDDPDINYATGEETTYGMHLAGMTAATEKRIHNLLR